MLSANTSQESNNISIKVYLRDPSGQCLCYTGLAAHLLVISDRAGARPPSKAAAPGLVVPIMTGF